MNSQSQSPYIVLFVLILILTLINAIVYVQSKTIVKSALTTETANEIVIEEFASNKLSLHFIEAILESHGKAK